MRRKATLFFTERLRPFSIHSNIPLVAQQVNASWKWKRWPDKRGWRSPAKSHPLSSRTQSNPREISFPVLILKTAVLGLYESFFFFLFSILPWLASTTMNFYRGWCSSWLGRIIIFVFVIKLLRLLLFLFYEGDDRSIFFKRWKFSND